MYSLMVADYCFVKNQGTLKNSGFYHRRCASAVGEDNLVSLGEIDFSGIQKLFMA